ncbi:LACX protein [Bacillus pseudomycoides]|uniref:aldose 1-epimerase family protein n=1 Tax=Bacillus TaxID=1386 RepID=UPI0004ED731F|nr:MULTISPECIES: aldose 1-epimerase family protein [Bacillus]AIK35669.1 aldose 1-epimerase family protein [Bacillus pseudomycoides]AJI18408.1 aldose 1-epimerase family protein [Bacillus pseudomycoides]MCX2826598.1 aldose 1-epimerase family protein [Bacillus sp. DHT2]MDR4914445.1 aldose 1-epimerase family protein [Bacillus pseudomycoides]MED4650360.1 aldose 1-epimerase family protein [Bacillus pseudomycoides]
MTATIQNEKVIVSISEKGAELQSVRLKEDNTEYMWQGNPNYWGRRAPILFPIVGRLVDNIYYVDGKPYSLTQHGFARDLTFSVKEQSETKITYAVTSNQETLQKYPYEFELRVSYELDEQNIHVTYEVINPTSKEMFFSIGAHPGFNCPLIEGESFTDYHLSFNGPEHLKTNVLKGPFLSKEKQLMVENKTELPLTYDLFKNDALIFENMNTNEISIRSHKHNKFVKVAFEGFPFVGVWTLENDAPFLCIEPWYGIADEVEPAKDFKEKKGVQSLQANETFTCRYSITIG